MNTVDLVRAIENAWNSAQPAKRLEAVKNLRPLVPEEQQADFDALIEIKLAGIQDNPSAVTVVLVHGIQTDGAWQTMVRQELKGVSGLNVVPIGYGFFSAMGLFGPFRRGPLNKLTRELREIRRMEPQARLMIIAHSFGSYLTSKVLEKNTDIEFERIILCGCIVSRKFRWDLFAKNMQAKSILNDVGTRDPYPLLATASTIGYGSSGRLGFQTAKVIDRYFNYGHSDFFSAEHVAKYWRPFIESGTVESSDWDGKRPKTGIVANLLSMEWKSMLGAYILVGGACYLAWNLLIR